MTFPVHLGNKDKDNPSSSLSRILPGLSWGRSHQEGRVVVAIVGKARGWVWLRMPHPCFLGLLSTLQLVCALCCLLCHAIPSRALTRGALWWPVAWKALVPLKETGFPNGSVVKKKKKKKSPCQCRRHRFNPWVKKIPWKRAWQPAPVFLPREFRGERSLVGYSP